MADRATALSISLTKGKVKIKSFSRANPRNASSREDEVKLEAAFDRRQLYAVLRIIAAAMDHAGYSAAVISPTVSQADGVTWLDDPFAYDQAVQAATHVLEAFRPSGKLTPVPGRFSHLGVDFAEGVLETIAGEEPTVISDTQIPPRSHRELGHLLARISPRKSKNRVRSQSSARGQL
jgi:hypothetical protein